jgi:hypothetical protein
MVSTVDDLVRRNHALLAVAETARQNSQRLSLQTEIARIPLLLGARTPLEWQLAMAKWALGTSGRPSSDFWHRGGRRALGRDLRVGARALRRQTRALSRREEDGGFHGVSAPLLMEVAYDLTALGLHDLARRCRDRAADELHGKDAHADSRADAGRPSIGSSHATLPEPASKRLRRMLRQPQSTCAQDQRHSGRHDEPGQR